jgi:hypothetical protein
MDRNKENAAKKEYYYREEDGSAGHVTDWSLVLVISPGTKDSDL